MSKKGQARRPTPATRTRLRPGPRATPPARPDLRRTERAATPYGTWVRREGEAVRGRTATAAHARRTAAPVPPRAPAAARAEEERARVGTGFRVRRDGTTRRFDVGFSDVKPYDRPEGRGATVAAGQTGFTLKATGPDARVRLGNAVHAVMRLRPRNAYTGTGILRKRDRGAKKLKPTKKDKA